MSSEFKGQLTFIEMKSGAIYSGIFQNYRAGGGGQILLSNVMCRDRKNPLRITVSPKKEMSRKFWISKIDTIAFTDGKNLSIEQLQLPLCQTCGRTRLPEKLNHEGHIHHGTPIECMGRRDCGRAKRKLGVRP